MRLNAKELIADARVIAPTLPPAAAKLMSEMADHLDVQFVALRESREQVKRLAAENATARGRHNFIRALAVSILEHSGGRRDWRGAMEDASDLIKTIDEVYVATPATDAFLASLRAEARKEGAIFAANRMLAAWDAGFVEDTPENAADIARAILTSIEFMDDAPEGDFDRSFADEMLEAIAAQLRSQFEQVQGVQS